MGWALPSAATAVSFAIILTISIPGRESPAKRRNLAETHLQQFRAISELGCARDRVRRGLRHRPISAAALPASARRHGLAPASSPACLECELEQSARPLCRRPANLRPGQMALAWAPADARRPASLCHYLPYDVPLVKRVSAVGDARVCAKGGLVLVDGQPVAVRVKRDPSGRTMDARITIRRFLEGPAAPAN